MNIIEKSELSNKLKYKSTVILTYKIQYPQINSSNYELGKNVFNQYNKEKAIQLEKQITNELFKEAKELYDYNSSHGYPIMVYEILLTYSITYNKGFIISLYSDLYEFVGGAHGTTLRNSQNWDLHTGVQLPLAYFYPNNSYYIIDILKEINSQIKEQIENGSNQYFDNYCELVLETFKLDNYYLTKNALAIFFQQYDIAPYSSGIPIFYIKYN